MPDKTYEFIGDVNTKEPALAEALRGVGVFVYEGKGDHIRDCPKLLERRILFVLGYRGSGADRARLEDYPGSVVLAHPNDADSLKQFLASPSLTEAIDAIEGTRNGTRNFQFDVFGWRFWKGLPDCTFAGGGYRLIEIQSDELAVIRYRQQIEELWEQYETRAISRADQFHALVALLKDFDFSTADETIRASLLDKAFPRISPPGGEGPEPLPFVEELDFSYKSTYASLFRGCENAKLYLRASALALYLTLGTMYMHKGNAQQMARIVGTRSLRDKLGLSADLKDWSGPFRFDHDCLEVDGIDHNDWNDLELHFPVLYSLLRIRCLSQIAIHCIDLLPPDGHQFIERLCDAMAHAAERLEKRAVSNLVAADLISADLQAFRGTATQFYLFRYRLSLEPHCLNHADRLSREKLDKTDKGEREYARCLNYRQKVLNECLFRGAGDVLAQIVKNEEARLAPWTAITDDSDPFDLNSLLESVVIAKVAIGPGNGGLASLQGMLSNAVPTTKHWTEVIEGSRKPTYLHFLGVSHALLLSSLGEFEGHDFTQLAQMGRDYWEQKVLNDPENRTQILHFISPKFWACHAAYLLAGGDIRGARRSAELGISVIDEPCFRPTLRNMVRPERVRDHFERVLNGTAGDAAQAARLALEVCNALPY